MTRMVANISMGNTLCLGQGKGRSMVSAWRNEDVQAASCFLRRCGTAPVRKDSAEAMAGTARARREPPGRMERWSAARPCLGDRTAPCEAHPLPSSWSVLGQAMGTGRSRGLRRGRAVGRQVRLAALSLGRAVTTSWGRMGVCLASNKEARSTLPRL